MVGERLTLAEIAVKYGKSRVQAGRWAREEEWPPPVGKRGRHREYDAAAVDLAVQAITGRRSVDDDGDPDELLDYAKAAEVAGIQPSTLYGYVSRGDWPEADDEKDGVKRWKRSTVTARMAPVRGYRRHGGTKG